MRLNRSLSAALLLVLAWPLAADTLVVANKSEASVSLIDLGSGKVAATLPVGMGPHEVAVSPNGRWALIANYGTTEQPGSSLTVIDVPGAKVVRTIALGEYRRPHGTVWIDDRSALVTAEANKALLEVDIEGGKVTRALPTGQETSHMVAVTPDRSRAFVANIGSGSVTAFDLKAGKHLGDIPTGAGTEGIDVSPDGKEVWVTSRAANTVSVLDVATLKVLATVDSPKFPIRAKVAPDGKRVLVSNAQSGDLSLLSVAERKVERRLPFALESAGKDGRLMQQFGASSVPIGIVIDPPGRRAFVAHANADRIAVVDLEQWKVTGSLTAGKEPDGMGYSSLAAGSPPGPRRD